MNFSKIEIYFSQLFYFSTKQYLQGEKLWGKKKYKSINNSVITKFGRILND